MARIYIDREDICYTVDISESNYVIYQAVVVLCVSCKAGRLGVSQCTLEHNHGLCMHFHDSKAWKALLVISYNTDASSQPQVYYVCLNAQYMLSIVRMLVESNVQAWV